MEAEAELLGSQLFEACLIGDIALVKTLIDTGAPLWYQEPESEWTCLHIAAERNDIVLIKSLLDAGAIWNAGARSSFRPGPLSILSGFFNQWMHAASVLEMLRCL